MYTRLLEKQPLITVDRNGGLFPPSAGYQGLTLVSGNDRAPDTALSEHPVQ